MFKFVGVTFGLFGVFFAAPAWAETAAELHLIKGEVLVANGGQFRLAGSAKSGDRIKVGPNSSAVLTFPGGCDVQLLSGQVYVVPNEIPCALASAPVQQMAPPPATPPTPVVVAATEPVVSTPLVIGASVLGAAAVGGGAYLLLVSRP
jgi:hypothetical protein